MEECLAMLDEPDDGAPPFVSLRAFKYALGKREVAVHFRAVATRDKNAWRWECLNKVVGDREWKP